MAESEGNDDEGSAALTCAGVYLLQADGTCYSCKQSTPMFGVMGLPPFALARPGHGGLGRRTGRLAIEDVRDVELVRRAARQQDLVAHRQVHRVREDLRREHP